MVAVRLVPTVAGNRWNPIAGVIVPDIAVEPSVRTTVPAVVEET